jgi:serine protease
VAALWLSYHGRDKLIEKYGIEKIPFIFNRILRDSCDRIPDWDSRKVGTGLVNAEKVLAAPLPDRFEELMVSPALDLTEHIPLDEGRIETFNHLFEQSLTDVRLEGVEESVRSNAVLESKLAELLGVSVAELPRRLKEVGQELAFHLATNPDVYKAFASASSRSSVERREFDLKDREMNVVLENANMQGVREKLLAKETSEAFKKVLLFKH